MSPRTIMRHRFASLLAIVLIGGSAAVWSQEDPVAPETNSAADDQPPQTTFGEAIDVRVVNVYVYVRDKKGNPVTGLSRDDFVLIEDGKEVPISNFYEMAGGERVGAEAEEPSQLERIKSHPELDPRVSQVPLDQRLWVVVYIDHFNVRPHNRNRVFRYLREFLRTSVGRDDMVMLASYNRSLKIERTFTRDPQLVSSALFELETHTGGRSSLDSERRDLLRDVQEARDPRMLEARIRLFAESQYNDLQFTLDSLKEMVDMLGGIPGRKALVYVSDGLPMRAGEDMFVAASERYPEELSGLRLESMQYDASRRYRDIASVASANQVAFYTIDATGLLGRSDRGAEMGSYHGSTQVESTWQSNMQQPLMMLADFTGGQSIINTNNFAGGFERIGSDFDYYYSLGYTPGHGGTGRGYDLKCKVKVRGVPDPRCRRSYRDKPLETEIAEATLAALQFGIQQNELGVRLEQQQMIRRTDGNYLVHVDVQIPLGEVTLVPRAGTDMHEGRVRVWVQAGDPKGRLSDVNMSEVPIQVPATELEEARERFWVYQLPLLMRAGDQRLSIAVRDDYSAKTSYLTRAFRVGS